MKRASTWALLLLLSGGATSCRSLLETASFEDGDPSSGSTGTDAASTSGSSTTGGGSTTAGGSSTTTSSGQGTGGEGAGGAGTGGESSPSGGGGSTGCPRSDDFDGPALDDCWVQNLEGATVGFFDDQFTVRPADNTGWWDPAGEIENTDGFRIHQPVSGAFVTTVHLDLDLSVAGEGQYQMGGFLFRNPNASGPEEWIKWEMGQLLAGENGDGSLLGVNSNADGAFHLLPYVLQGQFEALHVTLGVCRGGSGGSRLFFAYRLDGEAWETGHVAGGLKGHPTLDDTLEVSLIAGSYESRSLVTVVFDDFTIDQNVSPPGTLGECIELLRRVSPDR